MDWAKEAAKYGGTTGDATNPEGKDWAAEARKYGGSVAADESVSRETTPAVIGAAGFPAALKEVLAKTDWGTRNIAGAGSAPALAWEGIKGLFGKTNQQKVQEQKQISEAAPVGNLVGNAALFAPTALIPGANTLTGSALIGAVANALTTPGDARERGKAALWGAGGSLTGTALAKGSSKAAPKAVSPDIAALAQEGISLTPGQNMGGVFKSLEDKATSMPFVGNVIQNARRRGIEDFDKAAFNRVLSPLQKINPTTSLSSDTGRQGFANVKQAIGDAYDAVLPKLNNIGVDSQYASDMSQLKNLASTLPKDKAEQFNKILDYYVDSRFTPAGRMSGETMKDVESNLGQQAGSYLKSPLPDDRNLGNALKQAQDNLRQMVQRSNPSNAADLQKINGAFATYARLRKAASMTGTAAQEGLFTPAQLNNAVRAGDQTAGKSAYASGNALLQDLTDPAMRVMPSKVPDSGTAGRVMADLTNPFNWPGLAVKGAASLPLMAAYSRPGSAAINAAVNKGAIPLAELIRLAGSKNPDALRLGGLSLSKLMSAQPLKESR